MHFYVPTKAGGKARQLGAGRAAVWRPQAFCNNVAGPFPGFPEGLGSQASARGVAVLAKVPTLAADRALRSQAWGPNVGA